MTTMLEAIATWEEITPELALEMLSHNHNNRPVIQKWVARLAEEIASGHWQVTGDAIRFDTAGRLIDGQHRLMACVKSKMSIRSLVIRGIEPEATIALDEGVRRNARHVMAIAYGINVTKTVSAAAVAAYQISMHGTCSGWRGSISPRDLKGALDRHGVSVAAIVDAIGKGHDEFSQAALLGTLAILHHSKPDDALRFASMLRSGANLSEGHPVLTLRDRITRMPSSGGGGARRESISLLTVAAFDAFLRGGQRAFLREAPAARARYLSPWKAGV